MAIFTGIPPTKDEVKAARKEAKLTQAKAAAVVHVALQSWQRWEQGDHIMHPAYWELFLIKAGLKSS
jgi:DNA-binding transcriptional regulator YiaG